jgi:hypothetical protein
MARYYLHISNGGGYSEDPEGQELPDLEAARASAIEGARSLLSEEARQGQLDLSGRIDIADADGNILLSVPFGDAVKLRLDRKGA